MNDDSVEDIVLFTDGAALGNPGPAGIGIVFQTTEGVTLEEISEPIGYASNNVAEYRAVITALTRAIGRKAVSIKLITDSQLIVRQLSGEYRVKSPDLLPLFNQVRDLSQAFCSFEVEHVKRERNKRADQLASAAARLSARGDPTKKP